MCNNTGGSKKAAGRLGDRRMSTDNTTLIRKEIGCYNPEIIKLAQDNFEWLALV